MAPKPIGTVFFDLGDTLCTPELSPPPIQLVGFHVFPFVSNLLEQLRSRGLKLGIISNTGSDTGPKLDAILSTAGILASFNDTLRIYSADVGLTKADPAIFKLAAQRAGSPDEPATCLFVGEDPQERATAASAGLRVCPHPLLAAEVIDGEKLRYVRIAALADLSIAAFRAALRARPIVPMHVAGSGGQVVYTITSERLVAELINMRLGVELLGDSNAPENTELFLLQDDTARSSGYLSGEGQASLFFADRKNARLLVSATAEGLVIALPHGRSLGDLHLKRAKHGHTLKLMPDPMLLLDPVANPAVRAFAAAFDRPAALQTTLTPSEVQSLGGITASVIRDRIIRYSGAADIGGGSAERVKSRHISHRQNATAVDALAAELPPSETDGSPSSSSVSATADDRSSTSRPSSLALRMRWSSSPRIWIPRRRARRATTRRPTTRRARTMMPAGSPPSCRSPSDSWRCRRRPRSRERFASSSSTRKKKASSAAASTRVSSARFPRRSSPSIRWT